MQKKRQTLFCTNSIWRSQLTYACGNAIFHQFEHTVSPLVCIVGCSTVTAILENVSSIELYISKSIEDTMKAVAFYSVLLAELGSFGGKRFLNRKLTVIWYFFAMKQTKIIKPRVMLGGPFAVLIFYFIVTDIQATVLKCWTQTFLLVDFLTIRNICWVVHGNSAWE